jgi:AcrR family transcriptional regulator
MSPQTPRARRTRNSLSFDGILEAAERVAVEDGTVPTVRAVADELGSSPMALYRYFTTKDDLVDALLDRVLGRMAPGERTDDPRADFADFAQRHLALLLAHPWAVSSLITHPLPGPHAIPIGEEILSILDRMGVHGDEAVAIFSGIVALNYGWASFVVTRPRSDAASSMSRLDAGPPDGFPHTAAVGAAMARYGSPEHHATMVAALADGIRG